MGQAGDGPLVVGVGELLWDLFPNGRRMGGAPANFAYHTRALGARSFVVSRVGDDDLGRELKRALADRGLDTTLVSVDPVRATGSATVSLSEGGKPSFTIHEGAAWDAIVLTAEHTAVARRAAAVCFGTLAWRSKESRDAIEDFLDATPPECVRVFDINLRQAYFSAGVVREGLKRCRVVKLNDEELPVVRDLLGMTGTEAEVVARIVREFSVDLVALTRGENGCLLMSPGESVEHAGFPLVGIVDTVGAGDAFTAAVVMGLLKGASLARIAEHANRLASYVCSQAGAMPVVPAELRI